MRRFFTDAVLAGVPDIVISGPDANHIRNVLRLGPGDRIRLFDGRGGEWDGEITALTPDIVTVTVLEQVVPDTESPLDLTIAQGFLKDKKMDDLVRQLTELGMTRWVPFIAERSVARPDGKRLAARKERWEKIARESLKQCRRSKVPAIENTLSFREMLDRSRSADVKLIFWEEERLSPEFYFSGQSDKECRSVFAILGPEGGLSPQELDMARKSGFITATLGPRILRAETAAVAACTLIQHFFGDM